MKKAILHYPGLLINLSALPSLSTLYEWFGFMAQNILILMK